MTTSPQRENGFTAIANELMEALSKYRIPGEQMQCLLFILRKTYGFNKISDNIALSQFVKGTDLKKSSVIRALKSLHEKNIIIVLKKDTKIGKTYRFNKGYGSWEKVTKKDTTKKGTQKSKSSVTKKGTTKETITKEDLKDIVVYLNKKTKSSFRDNNKQTIKFIQTRWNDGFKKQDFFDVIDFKSEQWENDPKMNKYLRPPTLFGNKFEGYLQEALKGRILGDTKTTIDGTILVWSERSFDDGKTYERFWGRQ